MTTTTPEFSMTATQQLTITALCYRLCTNSRFGAYVRTTPSLNRVLVHERKRNAVERIITYPAKKHDESFNLYSLRDALFMKFIALFRRSSLSDLTQSNLNVREAGLPIFLQ